jgi:HEAT repeat protein
MTPRRRSRFVLSTGAALLVTAAASAQPTPIFPHRPPPAPTTRPPSSGPPASFGQSATDLRGRFGVDMATRLLSSLDPEDRLRGIERASEVEGTEALALLVQQVDSGSQTRADPRAMILVARGLARSVDQEKARTALVGMLSLPQPSTIGRGSDEGDPVARMQLARQTAALALASSRDERAYEQLVLAARAPGPAQAPALLALAAYPSPTLHHRLAGALLPPAMMRMLGETGDLRALDALRASLRAADPVSRASALLSLATLGDARTLEAAKAAMSEKDTRVRAAAAEALIVLDAPEKAKAVEALLGDDATAAAGVSLAERVSSDAITKALVARLGTTVDPAARAAIVAALGRSTDPQAIKQLLALLRDKMLQGDAAQAIARSPNPYAPAAVEAMLAHPEFKRLGLRAWTVRALLRGEKVGAGRELAERMAQSTDGAERAVGVFALVALGLRDVEEALADKDARVRRAGATAALAHLDVKERRALAAAFRAEKDPETQQVLALGLVDGDPEALATTTTLVDHAESGGPDAPLCALALARRMDDKLETKVTALFASRDPVLRAHVARGLGMSEAKDAVGRLANAYRFEADASVRRAIVRALVARRGPDESAPARTATLKTAARLDPDPTVRFLASRALAGRAEALALPSPAEVAWLRALSADGGPPPSGMVGALRRSDDLALPVAFDDDGYALVPGTPPGDAHLVLAPRLPTTSGPSARDGKLETR